MRSFLIILAILQGLVVYSQDEALVFESREMTFFGLDYTKTKLVGKYNFPPDQEIIHPYLMYWNDLMMYPDIRVDIGKPYKKRKVNYDTISYDYNRGIKEFTRLETSQILKKSEIEDVINKYINSEKQELGLVYIVDEMIAEDKMMTIWICFFEISSGKIVLAEPLRGKGKGRKFGDIWENAILDVYVSSLSEFKAWYRNYR